jgi:5-hydroxyisourate hydrolase-like protein (transthyretin family)
MNRTLRRPMFRMGGSTEGITSGLAPRQGYADPAGMVEKLQTRKNILDTLVPRTPRKDTSMRDFLINFGLDIASRKPEGSIFSTAAASAKDPFAKFQESKRLEDAYSMKETDEDRALVADLIKGMDDDKLSALMKDVKAGVESGLFADEKEGINQLLKKKIYGVQDMPGEAENKRIREIELMIARDQEVPAGMIKSVAQHIYKIETNAYPEDVQVDLNRTKTFIKPKHIAGVKKDEDGEIIEIVLDPNQAPPRTYNIGQIYFEPQTGELFKNIGKKGEAPRFVKVISE